MLNNDDVIYWVRSTFRGVKERVPMFYKGRWERDCENGAKGDVKVRPVSLGPGEFTTTINPDDCETVDGKPAFRK